MQLLDKKTITQQKNLERKLEIDEGIKLANKVDKLRQTAAEEETKLYKFRDESIKQVKKEIQDLVDRKESLKTEVEVLDATRAALMEPLDESWKIYDAKKLELENIEIVLLEKRELLDSDTVEYQKSLADLKLEESRIAVKKEEINSLLTEAVTTRSTAKEELRSTREQSSKILENSEIREKEVMTRELNVASKERDIINKEEQLKKDRRELDLREKSINDKYNQLLKTQARINKHG